MMVFNSIIQIILMVISIYLIGKDWVQDQKILVFSLDHLQLQQIERVLKTQDLQQINQIIQLFQWMKTSQVQVQRKRNQENHLKALQFKDYKYNINF